MDWRDQIGRKLVPLEKAVAHVTSGAVVGVAPYTCTPHTLCRGLSELGKRGGFKDVRIDHPAALFDWTEPEHRGVLTLRDAYATPPNRAACHAGEMEYLPVGLWRTYEVPPGFTTEPDVYLVPVSPPNERGYCSFGPGVWLSRTVSRGAKLVLAEVHEDFIRTFGENYIHVDEIDWLVEAEEDSALSTTPPPPPSEEEQAAVDVICNLVAAELVNDGDTLQMGVGTVSASLAPYLDFRNDLGIQTELITGGTVDLVKKGVVTGRYKSIHPHKVVASAVVALDREEMDEMHENPIFELYDFGYTDDLRRLILVERFVTVNNALAVDLTGQVAAESFDHRMYTGVGGQTVFMIAGAYSPGGKSVSVLPSSAVLTGSDRRVSRIVAGLPPGTPVTVPRTYVDYVVTEYGIAELCGKTVRERTRALLEVAHPDFRDDLATRATEMYGE
jgi:4-hydroxybutyrate CoA-transferase